jgi:cytochrome c oxidase cbb3-type subunit 4
MTTEALMQSIWTVVAFVIFVAIVIWAWSSKRKASFDKAARMALDDEESVSDDQKRD